MFSLDRVYSSVRNLLQIDCSIDDCHYSENLLKNLLKNPSRIPRGSLKDPPERV